MTWIENSKVIAVFLSFSLVICFFTTFAQYDNGKFVNCYNENDNWSLYAPDADNLSHIPIKTIRLYFHFIRNADCKNNFDDKSRYTAQDYAKDVEEAVNQRLATNGIMKAPVPDGCNSEYIADTRIRIKVMGVNYISCDDDCNSYGGRGSHNNHPCDCFTKYNVEEDKNINIYFMEDDAPEERIGGEAYHKGSCLSSYNSKSKNAEWIRAPTEWTTGIRIEGLWGILVSKDFGIWQAHNVVMHELGHIIGRLHHSWAYKDYQGSPAYDCCDTPRHKSDPSYNNQMDYGMGERCFTQCQVGFIHRTMYGEYFNYLLDDYCNYNPAESIEVSGNQDITWHTARMLKGDLYVRKGSSLTIRCTVGLPAGARIIVEAGAKLFIDNGKLTNVCGGQWLGVELHNDVRGRRRGKDRKAVFESQNGAVVDNSILGIRVIKVRRGRSVTEKLKN